MQNILVASCCRAVYLFCKGKGLVFSHNGDRGSQILSSWKEIASHLGKGVRTVQRWERDLGLPVRRPHGPEHRTVVALVDEIDAWARTFPQVTRNDSKWNGGSTKPRPDGDTHVLLINDDEVQLYATERMLTSLKYRVSCAGSGLAALEAAAAKPDIILLDVNLPDIHGFEVLRRLRNSDETRFIPVVFLSATYSPEGAGGVAIQLGAKAFLQHPLSVIQLQTAIESTLSGR